MDSKTFVITYKGGATREDIVADCDTVEAYVMSRFGLTMEQLKEHGTTVVLQGAEAEPAPKKAAKK